MKPLNSHDTNRPMYKGHPNDDIWRVSNTYTYATYTKTRAYIQRQIDTRMQTANKISRCQMYLDTNYIEN